MVWLYVNNHSAKSLQLNLQVNKLYGGVITYNYTIQLLTTYIYGY